MMPLPLDSESRARLRVISAPIIAHVQSLPQTHPWDFTDPDDVDDFLAELLARCRARAAERAKEGA
jgi:hypothetical protein